MKSTLLKLLVYIPSCSVRATPILVVSRNGDKPASCYDSVTMQIMPKRGIGLRARLISAVVSEDRPMPFVRITIVREAIADDPRGKKAAISNKVAAAISHATNLPETEISIVFDEVAAADWYVGSQDVESLRLRGGDGQRGG